MLAGYNLIYFAPERWDGLWRNRHQLMSVFARQNKVLFVEPRLHLRPTLTSFRQGDLRLPDVFCSPIRQIAENLFVFRYPVWAPISGCFPIGQMARMVRRLSMHHALRKLRMSEPIVWLSRPGMVDLVREVSSARLIIYHVVDEYSAYSDHTPARGRGVEEREREMMAQVDVVIVVSQALYEAKCPLNPDTYLVPNGVNYQAFTAALVDPYLPEVLRLIKAPRLGYSGLIGDKLDLRMLEQLAQRNPAWSLVLLGEVRVPRQAETWQRLLGMSNVHYLGLVDISQVPHYLKGLDVGLMPYVRDRHAEHVSPLKLYDYLAAGLPVASMNIPAAREFSPYIHLVDSPRDFARAVRAALADTTPERRQARRDIAAEHTWETRVERISNLIQVHLGSKGC